MKTLLELLVENLKVWPANMSAIVQDSDGNAHAFNTYLLKNRGGDWWPACAAESVYLKNVPAQLCSDQQRAIVTRESWEAAKRGAGDE